MGILKINLKLFLIIVGSSSIVVLQPDHEQVYGQVGLLEKIFSIGQKTEGYEIFPKRKKRQKGNTRMKRHNRSMGKKFQKKNGDSVRDRL